MDIVEAFNTWTNDMGNTLNNHDDEQGNYVVDFIENGKVVGNVTSYPGQGMSWNYPQSLIDYKHIL